MMALARLLSAETAGMIRFACPTCGKVLKAHDNRAGGKGTCTRCGQRLKVPPTQFQTKTVLGRPVPDGANVEPAAPDEPTDQLAGAGLSTDCPHCGRTGIR